MRVPIIHTPTIYLEDLGVYVKLESIQYTGSTKVRPAYFVLKDAMRKGLLKEGDTFVEASSGNAAIDLAHLRFQVRRLWNSTSILPRNMAFSLAIHRLPTYSLATS